jgi:hypothetical protein
MLLLLVHQYLPQFFVPNLTNMNLKKFFNVLSKEQKQLIADDCKKIKELAEKYVDNKNEKRTPNGKRT